MDAGESVEKPAFTRHPMFRPDLTATRITDVSLSALAERGIRGLIIDLDNTVCAYRSLGLIEGVREWVAAAKEAGFVLVIVSNNFPERVAAIGRELGIPGVPSALKPLPGAFLRALRLLGTPRRHTAIIGDQLFTDVLGAKILGMQAVLTEPIVPSDFPLTRVLRFMERAFFAREV
jgi:HAD superfamily phosphatase (TIGR01668 family)